MLFTIGSVVSVGILADRPKSFDGLEEPKPD